MHLAWPSNSLATQVTPAVGSSPAPRFPQQELRAISCALGMALYSNSLATQVSQPVGSTCSALSHNKIYLNDEGHTRTSSAVNSAEENDYIEHFCNKPVVVFS